MTYVICKNSSTFEKKHVGQYSEGNGVFKNKNFDL